MPSFYQVVDLITKASVVPGICLNCLLIFLVKNFSRAEIGTFHYLLIVFASYDILLILLHFAFDPKYLVQPGIFSAVLDFSHGTPVLTLIHCVCFMVSYAILITHLLYRYWVIHKPHKIALFSSPFFVLKLCGSVLSIFALVTVVCWSVLSPDDSPGSLLMRSQFRSKFGKDIKDGWVVAEYWKDGRFNIAGVCAAALVDAVGVAIVIAVVALASLTYHHITKAFGLSAATRTIQMKLLKTVCVQTFIPLVCVAIPYFCNTTLPIFGVTFPFITETTGISMSLFPSWDPLAVIVLMKPYRDGFWSMVTARIGKSHLPVAPISMTTSVHSPVE